MHREPEPQRENRQRGGGERKKTSYIYMGWSHHLPLPTVLSLARMALENMFPETLNSELRSRGGLRKPLAIYVHPPTHILSVTRWPTVASG